MGSPPSAPWTEIIAPGEAYPTKGHADGHHFDIQKEEPSTNISFFINPRAKVISNRQHIPETRIKAGHISSLPGRLIPPPLATKGWKSYWIGFKGKNIDYCAKAGFLSAKTDLPRRIPATNSFPLRRSLQDSTGKGDTRSRPCRHRRTIIVPCTRSAEHCASTRTPST